MFDSRLDLGTYGYNDFVKMLQALFCVAFITEFFSYFKQVVFVFRAQILTVWQYLAHISRIASFTDVIVFLSSLVKVHIGMKVVDSVVYS